MAFKRKINVRIKKHSQAFNAVHKTRAGKFSSRFVVLNENLHNSVNKIFKRTLQFDLNWNVLIPRRKLREYIRGCYHSMRSKLDITEKIAECSFHLLIFYFLPTAKQKLIVIDCSFCQREEKPWKSSNLRKDSVLIAFSHTSWYQLESTHIA